MQLSRRSLLAGSAGTAAISLAGCSADGDAADLAGFVGIALPGITGRWDIEGHHLEQLIKDAGMPAPRLEFGEEDVETQISQIESMIGDGVEFLVIAAIDSSSLGPVLAEAKDQGITIIAYDRLIRDTPDVDYYLSFDNYQVGVLQAQHIIESLDISNQEGPFYVELFSGDPEDNNAELFFLGSVDTLERFIYDGKVQVRSGQTEQTTTAIEGWVLENSVDRMEDLLDEFYQDHQIDAVLSPADLFSRAIVEVLVNHGYDPDSDSFPVVTGQDANVESVKDIKDGTGQDQTVFKDTRELAEATMRMLTDLTEGRSPEINDRGSYDNGFKFVPTYLLEPVQVDRSNWEQVLVESEYFTMQEIDEAA
ncbi:sugar ABC transporter substrate-binding protein [Glycomyces albus]